MKHIMLDIETMGNIPNSAIVSLGAVEFSVKEEKTGHELYQNIDLQSCLDAGLVVTGDTVEWWMKQSASARGALFNNAIPLADALDRLDKFFKHCKARYVWGRGPAFDCVIVRSAYLSLGRDTPWRFWNERCVRTVCPKKLTNPSASHNALDDAKCQAIDVISQCNKYGITF